MSEIYTVKAKTVAEAMQLASQMYGGTGKELSYDIVSTEKRGFLGIGARDAEIRVTVSEGLDTDLSDIVGQFRSSDKRAHESRAGDSRDTAKRERAQSGVPKVKREVREQKPDISADENSVSKTPENSIRRFDKPHNHTRNEVLSQKKEAAPARPVQKKEESTAQPEQKHENAKPTPKRSDSPVKAVQKKDNIPAKNGAKTADREEAALKVGVSESEMNYVLSFINKMIAGMKLSAEATAVPAPEGVEYVREAGSEVYPAVEITGSDTGILIGHHGETLDAIQYLSNLALFRRDGSARGREHISITVDIENYRAKREETLRSLARRMAARAVKYKRNVFLEPMNPYERRIIHSELQNFEGVSTHSVGSDVNRKIVITFEGAGRTQQNNRRRGHGVKPVESTDVQAEQNESAEASVQTYSGSADEELTTASRIPLPTLDD